jgi:hypothetical protein
MDAIGLDVDNCPWDCYDFFLLVSTPAVTLLIYLYLE